MILQVKNTSLYIDKGLIITNRTYNFYNINFKEMAKTKGTLFCEPLLLLSKLAGNLPVAAAFFFVLLLDGKDELKAFEYLVLLLHPLQFIAEG